MKIIIDLAYLSAGIVLMPWILYRMLRYKRYRKGWANRIGNIRRKYPEKQCVWIHAVSVGEVNATRTVVKELETGRRKFTATVRGAGHNFDRHS